MRSIVLACSLSAIASPALAQIVRVSVSTAGVEANGPSGPPSISGDGRYVVFASDATNLVTGDTNGVADVFLRDRDTDADGIFDEAGAVATTRISLGPSAAQADAASLEPAITPDGRYVAFVSAASNLAPDANGSPQVYRLDRTTGGIVRVSESTAGAAGDAASGAPAISADGDVVAFQTRATNLGADAGSGSLGIVVREITADRTTRITPPPQSPGPNPGIAYVGPSISDDGTRVAYLAITFLAGGTGFVFDRTTGATQLATESGDVGAVAISASGLEVIWRTADAVARRVIDSGAATPPLDAPAGTPAFRPAVSPSGRYVLTAGARLNDFDFGTSSSIPFVPGGGDFSADDRWLAVVSGTSTLVAGDTNGVDDVFVLDLPDVLDADNDTMDDRWETLFSVTDPAADPDADGQTNAQEENAGTHPNGQARSFLAEGATGRFFHTTIALANPSPTLAAAAVLTFDRGNGTRVRRPITIPAGRSAVVDVGAVTGLETADVSTTVESDRLLGVERSMTWGTSPDAIYGSHAETGAPAPSTTWYVAEGSTVLGFDLFYLLQNPQATPANATVNFLLPSGTTVARTYTLAPGSRATIYVNQIEGLDETDVSGGITADVPIVVERAMYRSLPGQPFSLGTNSMGVPAAATSWFLAEGATGAFFDLYVLIANPGNTDATVTAQFAKPDGTVVNQTYGVRAHSRFSIYVDAIPGLESTGVATTLTSTNGVPIVAERAMYWPGGFFDYYEGHSSAGSTSTALEWVVSGAEEGGAERAQTFVLIANTATSAGEATISILPDRDYTGTVPAPLIVALPANSRTTVPVTSLTGPFGIRVESTGGAPVPLVVESAVYRSAEGVLWSAGSNALATPVP
jgi:WD40-like Beta Propeller Repeat